MLTYYREQTVNYVLAALWGVSQAVFVFPLPHLPGKLCSAFVHVWGVILYTIQKALSLNVYQILNSPLRCTFLESAVFHPGLGQITCKSPRYRAANHLAIVLQISSLSCFFSPKTPRKTKKHKNNFCNGFKHLAFICSLSVLKAGVINWN